MAQRIEPGTRWRQRRGDHAGAVVEIEGQTFAGGVKYHVVRNGASQDDNVDGRVHLTPQDQFLALYERDYKAAPGRAAVAFRQDNSRRRAQRMKEQQMTLEPIAAPSAPPRNGQKPSRDEPALGIAIETITPEMAQTWLDRGGANRHTSERRILRLVNAIELGEWQLTGDSIKLDAEGRVRDGKHRLTAIVRSKTTVQALVVRGVTEAAFDVIDTGKSRTPADVLAIHGHTSTVAKATAARGLIIIERTGRYLSLGSNQALMAPSNAAILAYVEAHPELVEAVGLADRLRISGGFFGGSGLWAIAITMFLRISVDQTRVFVNSLIEGANLEHGSPILRLRNMYKGNARAWASSGDNRERLLATAIKGWNAWRRDELIQALSWHNTGRSAEGFPVAE